MHDQRLQTVTPVGRVFPHVRLAGFSSPGWLASVPCFPHVRLPATARKVRFHFLETAITYDVGFRKGVLWLYRHFLLVQPILKHIGCAVVAGYTQHTAVFHRMFHIAKSNSYRTSGRNRHLQRIITDIRNETLNIRHICPTKISL